MQRRTHTYISSVSKHSLWPLTKPHAPSHTCTHTIVVWMMSCRNYFQSQRHTSENRELWITLLKVPHNHFSFKVSLPIHTHTQSQCAVHHRRQRERVLDCWLTPVCSVHCGWGGGGKRAFWIFHKTQQAVTDEATTAESILSSDDHSSWNVAMFSFFMGQSDKLVSTRSHSVLPTQMASTLTAATNGGEI